MDTRRQVYHYYYLSWAESLAHMTVVGHTGMPIAVPERKTMMRMRVHMMVVAVVCILVVIVCILVVVVPYRMVAVVVGRGHIHYLHSCICINLMLLVEGCMVSGFEVVSV